MKSVQSLSSDTSATNSCTSLGYLTHCITRLVTRDADCQLRPLNISAAQLAPLLVLFEHGPMLQRDIVKISAVAQPAMVATLAKLEDSSLIERCSDEHDRRASLIALTAQGRELVEKASPILTACNTRALSSLSPQEQQTLLVLLERIILDFDKEN